MHKHVILIGFKNVGKSALGKELAKQMGRPFVDLDEAICLKYSKEKGKKTRCRDIVLAEGEEVFRTLEWETLSSLLKTESQPLVLSLGGGAPMRSGVRELLKAHYVVHVTAPKGIVYERIMVHGFPAFFPKNESAFASFERLWKERTPVFKTLANLEINNTTSVKEMVQDVLHHLA